MDIVPSSIPLPGTNGYTTGNFRIGPSDIAGLGMFANKDLPKGTCIVKECTVTVPVEIMKSHAPVGSPLVQLRDSEASIAGPNIAIVNHCCTRWNSTYANRTGVSMELVAVSSIKRDEEISLGYWTKPRMAFRQKNGTIEGRANTPVTRAIYGGLVRKQFGFDCACADCIKDKVCYKCQKVGPLKKCSACGVAWYCGRSCQISDWSQHKIMCSAWKSMQLHCAGEVAKKISRK